MFVGFVNNLIDWFEQIFSLFGFTKIWIFRFLLLGLFFPPGLWIVLKWIISLFFCGIQNYYPVTFGHNVVVVVLVFFPNAQRAAKGFRIDVKDLLFFVFFFFFLSILNGLCRAPDSKWIFFHQLYNWTILPWTITISTHFIPWN